MKHLNTPHRPRYGRFGSPRSDKLEEFLTHYYVVRTEEGDVAIGEAGDVQTKGPDQWTALVARWGIDPVANDLEPAVIDHVQQMEVAGPGFGLVPKAEFTGRIHSWRS